MVTMVIYALGGADAAKFSINSDGNIDSNGALDFSTQENYVFTLSYTESAASGSDTFVDTITLSLNDTLTSTATVTAEETELLSIPAVNFLAQLPMHLEILAPLQEHIQLLELTPQSSVSIQVATFQALES